MALDKQDVRRAFQEDEFFPFFQPLVRLSTDQLIGFEALARWNHATLGAIPPNAFLPILQSHGLINTLTQRLLEKIFAVAPLLPDSLRLSVNISPLQFLDTTLPGRFAVAAARECFPLNRLTIEMTESALIENLSVARAVSGEFKDLGCRLSLDDFGKGHSSFLHLQALPFDELKVDRGFVCAMTKSTANYKIVSAIIGLGRSLGLATVAEGVETVEQAAMVSEMGCEFAQGWLFGVPVPTKSLHQAVSVRRNECGRASSTLPVDAAPCPV
jgi:EAL domain-containing protein (putative c-di-GMP-specific phosphodiesterase class I)